MADVFVNVVSEGPLAQWHCTASLRVDRSIIDMPAPTLRALDTQCLDFSRFFPDDIFPPDFVERHAHVELRSPLEVVVRPKQAIILSNASGIVVNELQLNLKLRKARTTPEIDISLSKFHLCWQRDVAAMVDQAVTQIGSGAEPAYIGAVAACGGTPPPLPEAQAPSVNIFLRWEYDESTKRTLVGQSLLIEHSGGVKWRVINVSPTKEATVWALDSFTVYLTLDDLAGPPSRVNARLTLTSVDGRSVRLGTIAEQVLNIDANPVEPLRVIRVVNASYKQVPLSFAVAPIGWTLRLEGEVYIPARESCSHGEWIQAQTRRIDTTLLQQSMGNHPKLTISDYSTVMELAAVGPYHFYGRRVGQESFQLVYILYIID